jgi:hypothetical protein
MNIALPSPRHLLLALLGLSSGALTALLLA